jgi:hypothetical protein
MCVSLLAELEFTLDLAARAAGQVRLEAMIGEAVLELDIHRTAAGVESEHRIGSLEIDPVDGNVGDQVLIHRIAEWLIEADTVDIHGESLRRSSQGRRRKPVIEECRGKRIVGR